MIDPDVYRDDLETYRPISGIFFIGPIAVVFFGIGLLIGWAIWS